MTESDQIIVSSRALDGVLQRIFNAGLILNRLRNEADPGIADPLQQVIGELDAAVQQLRLARLDADSGSDED